MSWLFVQAPLPFNQRFSAKISSQNLTSVHAIANMGKSVMEEGIVNFIHEIFSYFRNNPLFYDHYDKLFAILGVLLIIYFVGALARNLLLGALIVFLLWGFRYQDLGESRHANRYTGAVCDTGSECWQPERFSDIYDRSSRDRSSYDRPSYRY